MKQDEFQMVCDQFSSVVDDAQFERFRWDRDEAPKLARMVELVQAAFEGRRDFELTEEGATSDLKKYVLKVHGMRTVAIAFKLEDGEAVFSSETIDRSAYTLASAEPVSTDYKNVDEQWIANTLKTLIGRIRAPATEAQPEVPAASHTEASPQADQQSQ